VAATAQFPSCTSFIVRFIRPQSTDPAGS